MDETAVETVSETASSMPTSAKVIIVGVGVAVGAAATAFVINKVRKAKAAKKTVEEPTVLTPDEFIPASK